MQDYNKKIYLYLNEMVKKHASDVYITVGMSATYKVNKDFIKSEEPKHTEDTIHEIIKEFLTPEQYDEYISTFELNIALHNNEDERFRINLFFQQRNMGIVARHVKSKIPSFSELKIPEKYKDFIMQNRGLFLMVGATGSGKSSSLAAMLEYRNQNGSGHIVSIEDPIEFVFKQKNCIFTQREVGIDTYSYGIAMKNSLRQAPDVIFIGEIRDRDSMENAVAFSETGHLVVATIHANNTGQTFERILSFYPEEVHNQVLISLSHNLIAIAGQRLVKNVNNELLAAHEILINEGLISDLIKEGKFAEMKDVMKQNLDNGMMTFDECLFRMFRQRSITKDTALKEADNPNNLRLKISQYSDVNLATTLKGIPKTSLSDNQLSNYSLNNLKTDN
jgi:twitching motility protein PilU